MEGRPEEHQATGGQIRSARVPVPSLHGLGEIQVSRPEAIKNFDFEFDLK